MGKVKKSEFSKSRPTLKADDLPRGMNATVVTIGSVERITLDDQPKLVMGFDEWPEHSYFPNVTSIGNLIEYLGDETDDWKGQRVALIVAHTTNPQNGKAVKALWVAPADEQDDILGKRRTVPAKRGRKAKK